MEVPAQDSGSRWEAQVLIPIGVPSFMFWLLWKHREKLHAGDLETTREFSSLVGNYAPRCYYWEVVEMTRKLTMTGFIMFVAPGSPIQVQPRPTPSGGSHPCSWLAAQPQWGPQGARPCLGGTRARVTTTCQLCRPSPGTLSRAAGGGGDPGLVLLLRVRHGAEADAPRPAGRRQGVCPCPPPPSPHLPPAPRVLPRAAWPLAQPAQPGVMMSRRGDGAGHRRVRGLPGDARHARRQDRLVRPRPPASMEHTPAAFRAGARSLRAAFPCGCAAA